MRSKNSNEWESDVQPLLSKILSTPIKPDNWNQHLIVMGPLTTDSRDPAPVECWPLSSSLLREASFSGLNLNLGTIAFRDFLCIPRYVGEFRDQFMQTLQESGPVQALIDLRGGIIKLPDRLEFTSGYRGVQIPGVKANLYISRTAVERVIYMIADGLAEKVYKRRDNTFMLNGDAKKNEWMVKRNEFKHFDSRDFVKDLPPKILADKK